MSFRLSENDKFALVAVDNVYTNLADGFEAQLKDGTWVLTKVPFEIESIWKDWTSVITSKAANDNHLKTGQWSRRRGQVSSTPFACNQASIVLFPPIRNLGLMNRRRACR